MNPAMQTVARTYELGNRLFMGGVATLDDADARRIVADNTNPVIWLAGHLLNSRKYLLGLFGDERELTWEMKFRDKYDPSTDYPPMSELVDTWTSISDALHAKIKQADDEQLAREITWDLPNGDKTVRGALLFYSFHEAWHLGQIAYALRGMGKDGLVRR